MDYPAQLDRRQLDDLDRRLCEGRLIRFLELAWPNFDSSQFTGGRHLDMIAEHLEAVTYGEIRRLLINVPPRFGKTNLVAVAWPTWTWLLEADPEYPLMGAGVRFLCASYGANKAQGDGVTARRLIGSEWYQRLWGKRYAIVKDRDNQEQYDTDKGGSRISTGIPESLGKGGAIRLIDDPHKTDEVESPTVLPGQIKAYDEVWRTRSNDPAYGAEVIIMQRLGEGDLSGHILAENDPALVHVCLPARYESDRTCVTVIGEEWRERDGELLWPERFDEGWAISQEKRIGPYAWAGQYQQRPSPRGGGIIRREWWQQFGPDDPFPKDEYGRPARNSDGSVQRLKFPAFSFVLACLDGAYTAKEQNDPSALVTLGVFSDPETDMPAVMLVHAWQGRFALNDLVIEVDRQCRQRSVDMLLIENKATGISVEQELYRLFAKTPYGVQMLNPGKGDGTAPAKVARAHSMVPVFSEGMVWYPNTSWAEMVMDQVTIFPRGTHDDLVDALIHCLRFLRDNGMLARKQEVRWQEQDLESEFRSRGQRKSLYPV